jgi:peptidyl-prolyl cis-trans isomerase A (cyclophilin A)
MIGTDVNVYSLVCSWSYILSRRSQELTDIGFWDDCRFFRVLPGFVVQFGINGNPDIQKKWRTANMADDAVKVSNDRGTVVFATAGPNSRTTQLFINTREQGNAFLDGQGFSPIGRVIEGKYDYRGTTFFDELRLSGRSRFLFLIPFLGMDVVDEMYAGYGEGAPAGRGPNQGLIQLRGNSYLRENFPKLTYIHSVK